MLIIERIVASIQAHTLQENPLMHSFAKLCLRLAKISAGTILAILVLATLLLLIVFTNPQILLNDKVLRKAADFAPRFGISVQWSGFHFRLDSPELLLKNLRFEWENFKFSSGELSFSSARLMAEFHLDLSSFPPKLLQLGPIDVIDGTFHTTLSKGDSSSEEKSTQEPLIPVWVGPVLLGSEYAGTRFAPMTLDFSEIKIIDGTTTIKSPLRLNLHYGYLDFQVKPTIQENSKSLLESELLAKGAVGKKLNVRANAKLEGRAQAKLDGSLRIHPQANLLDFSGNVYFVDRPMRIQSSARIQFSPERIQLRLEDGQATGIAQELPKVTWNPCLLESTKESLNKYNLNINCDPIIRLPFPPETRTRYRLPQDLGVKLAAHFQTNSFIPSASTHFDGNIEIESETIKNSYFEGNFNATGKLAGKIEDAPDALEKWEHPLEGSIWIHAPRFEKWVGVLNVPAPLRELKGPLTLNANFISNSAIEFPFQLETRLNSRSQTLHTTSTGRATLSEQKFHVESEVSLDRVQLRLPRLELAAPPQILPDPRFKLREQAGKAAPHPSTELTYRLHLKTPPDRPVRLVSNLASAPLPVSLDLNIENGKSPTGLVSVSRFPIQLFQRKAQINEIQINLIDPMESSVIAGGAQISYADYTVFAKLSGDIEHSRVTLSSDPPLSDSEIISTLLFGEPRSEVATEDAESVNSTRKILTEGILGLGSLYFLASTPIQSVGYDPTTKEVSAKLKIGEGTSLNIGSGNKGLLGLRKRLGSKWVITTEVSGLTQPLSSSTTATGQQAFAYLEWIHRY